MVCKKCNAEIEDGITFCPFCGEKAIIDNEPVAEIITEAPPKNKILDMLSDKIFMAMCILLSVNVGAGVMNGSFDIFGILILIFMWIVFAGVKNGKDVRNNMRAISGTLFAEFVTFIALAVIFGLIFIVLIAAVSIAGPLFREALAESLNITIGGSEFDLSLLGEIDLSTIGVGIFVVLLVVFEAVFAVAIITIKKIHSFAKDLYQNLDTPECLTKVESGRAWMIVLSVFACISVLSSVGGGIISFLASASSATIYILAAILIKKHLLEQGK